jgi:hypothetical protein
MRIVYGARVRHAQYGDGTIEDPFWTDRRTRKPAVGVSFDEDNPTRSGGVVVMPINPEELHVISQPTDYLWVRAVGDDLIFSRETNDQIWSRVQSYPELDEGARFEIADFMQRFAKSCVAKADYHIIAKINAVIIWLGA